MNRLIILIVLISGILYSEECSCNNRMYQVCGDDGFMIMAEAERRNRENWDATTVHQCPAQKGD